MSGEWLHWYYLIFLLPAAIAVLVLAMSAVGGQHMGHGGHGHLHLHAHVGGGIHTHAPAAAAAHGPAAAHAGHSGHGAHHAHGGGSRGGSQSATSAAQLLGFLGFGRAPITIVIGGLMIGWGIAGTFALEVLRPILHYPALFFLPALGIALVGALVCAKIVGELSARLMPQEESFAIALDGLIGLTGKVVYPVTEGGGRVHIFDSFGTLHVSPARVAPGAGAIEKGSEVIVASMDPEHRFVVVEPLGPSPRKA